MRQPNPEELPLHASKGKRRQYGWNGRDYHGPKRGPLLKWLQSWVGYPWSEVHSAAKEKFSREEFEVVDYYVTKEFAGYDEHGNPIDVTNRWVLGKFYINEYGLLTRVPKMNFGPSKPRQINLVELEGKTYGLWSGLWYELTLEKIPEPHYELKECTFGTKNHKYYQQVSTALAVFDVWYREYWDRPARSAYGNGTYCCKYKQTGKRALKKIKQFLENLK